MTYEFAKYPDGTLGVFSNIGKKENGEEYIRITFERPKEYGFDTYVIELPSYEVVFEDGNYTEEEKKTFLLRNHLALWDVIESCDIKGSSDSSITNVKVNDLDLIVKTNFTRKQAKLKKSAPKIGFPVKNGLRRP